MSLAEACIGSSMPRDTWTARARSSLLAALISVNAKGTQTIVLLEFVSAEGILKRKCSAIETIQLLKYSAF